MRCSDHTKIKRQSHKFSHQTSYAHPGNTLGVHRLENQPQPIVQPPHQQSQRINEEGWKYYVMLCTGLLVLPVLMI